MKPGKKNNPWRLILYGALAVIILAAGLHLLVDSNEGLVDFADPQLALTFRNHLEMWDGTLYLDDVRQISVRDAYGMGIYRLDGIEHLSILESLNLRDNVITDLRPLAGLRELRCLNIHSNPVEVGLEAIGNLHHLETLIMRNIFIGEDYQFMLNLTNLQGVEYSKYGNNHLCITGDVDGVGSTAR